METARARDADIMPSLRWCIRRRADMEGIGDELVERVLFDSSRTESYVSDEQMVIVSQRKLPGLLYGVSRR
jgi:hypothetical protein